MEDLINKIVGYKFDLIKVLISDKSMSKSEFQGLKQKLLLADKLQKSYKNKENINTEELNQIKGYLDSKSKKRR